MSLVQSIQFVVSSAGAFALFVGAVFAPDAVGTWNMKMTFGERKFESKLTIAKGKDEALKGKWTGRRGDSEVDKLKFQDGKLSFVRMAMVNGRQAEMSFEGKIDGDKLTGQFTAEFGEIDVHGERVPAATPKSKIDTKPVASPLVGTWDVTTKSQSGERKGKLVFKADMSGTHKSERGEWPVSNVKLDGNKVTYRMVIVRQEREFELEFTATLDGTKLTGTYSVGELGDVAEVTANKAMPKPELALVGTWDLEITSERSDRTAKFIVKKDLTATYRTANRELRVDDLRIENGQVRFTLKVELQDRELILDFKGKLKGGSPTGIFEIDGNDVADVDGKRAVEMPKKK